MSLRSLQRRALHALSRKMGVTDYAPSGHFYSPVLDRAEVAASEARLWPAQPRLPAGIDFNDASHRHILETEFPRYIADFDYTERGASIARGYFTDNPQFGWLDAKALFVLLRAWRPTRVIEVGSGHSSLLMADVNQRFHGGNMHITCIEPYPETFLQEADCGIDRLIQAKVQDVPLEEFDALAAGDVLFIDSSHVSKAGSDVNHLFFEVLPRLASGVRIHIHDVFLPFEYPRDWLLEQGRSWNEQYLLQALLMYNPVFAILFGSSYSAWKYPELMHHTIVAAEAAAGGGSLWIEKR
ncbi:MAG: class I SAM-dependent methyltransferase [Pseudoxanthomonas sp.]